MTFGICVNLLIAFFILKINRHDNRILPSFLGRVIGFAGSDFIEPSVMIQFDGFGVGGANFQNHHFGFVAFGDFHQF